MAREGQTVSRHLKLETRQHKLGLDLGEGIPRKTLDSGAHHLSALVGDGVLDSARRESNHRHDLSVAAVDVFVVWNPRVRR